MPQRTAQINTAIGGVSIQGKIVHDAEGEIGQTVDIPKGQAGTLTTRTDNDTGIATLSTGHGLVTGNKVDVVWAGGSRIGMDATVSGNAVTVNLGAGTNLPAQDTAVTLYRRLIINQVFDGDKVLQIEALLPVAGVMSIISDAPAAIVDETPLVANKPWFWFEGTGAANPLTGETVATIEVASRATANSKFKLCALIDSVL